MFRDKGHVVTTAGKKARALIDQVAAGGTDHTNLQWPETNRFSMHDRVLTAPILGSSDVNRLVHMTF
jgi:hypothetical protein